MSTEVTPNFIAASASNESTPRDGWPLVERRRQNTDRRKNGGDRRAEGSPRATSQYDDHIASRLSALADSKICTARERQIVRLLLHGMTNKQIAQQLQIVEDTVKKHLQHVYAKLGVHRRTLVIVGQTGVRRRDNKA